MKNGEPEHQRRVADWQHTAAVALVPALVAMPLAADSTPRWDVGDLVVGLYFALTSLVLYLQSLRVRPRSSPSPITRPVAIGMSVCLLVGLLLVALDISSAGRV